MKLLNLLLLSAACCGAAAQAADSYPTKSIELVVSYQPGGGSDSTARAIADAARPLMPQSVVVLNRPAPAAPSAGLMWPAPTTATA